MMDCPCSEPGWCEEFKRNLSPTQFDICRGMGVTPEQQERYFALWRRQGMMPQRPQPQPQDTTQPQTPKKPCNCKKEGKRVLR